MASCDSGFWQRAAGTSGKALVACALLAPATASALWEDRLEIFAAENVTYDNNVFRISDRLDSGSAIGDSRRSDTVFTTSVGFTLDVPYSLQRL